MAICPECDEPVVIDEEEVDEGDIVSCEECGSVLRVVGVAPLEFEAVDDDDDEDDEDGDFDDEDEDEDDEDSEDGDDEKTEDWDE